MAAQSIRVLFVEDNEDDAELVKLEFEANGFAVEGHRVDARAAFLAALDEPWDLILSDYHMPDFSGLEAFDLYRAAGLDVPFIFVSGALGEEAAVRAMRAGARDYLPKDNLTRLGVAVKREIDAAEDRRRQRVAEARAKQDQRRLAMAVEASGGGVYEFSLPGPGPAYVSERWAEILGYAAADVRDRPDFVTWLTAQIHPDDRDYVLAARAAARSGTLDRYNLEFRLRHAAGHWVYVGSAAKVVERDPAGQTKIIGVLTDLTERKRLEAQFRQAQKMEAVGRLAGSIAHDFNNLLTVIYSFGALVREQLAPGDAVRDDVQEILNAAEKAAALTAQLLAFSRRKVVAPRVLDVSTIVRELDRLLRRLLGADIDLRTLGEPALYPVRIDPSAFEQVLMNLAVNAHDAMPDGGKLTIESHNVTLDASYGHAHGVDVTPGPYVVVAVSDTGCGMDEEVQRQIFEPFFTTKAEGKGTGLGLSTCYGVVKQAGGFIWLYSEVGVGTTFMIHLPAVDEPLEPVTVSAEPTSTRGDEVVLLAEDNDAVRNLAARLLRRLGYRVTEAADAQAALAASEHLAHIDLLVTDVVMPRMSGVELAHELTAARPGLKVLFMSGYTENGISHRGMLGPGARMLHKPFTPEVLARAVRQALDEGSATPAQ